MADPERVEQLKELTAQEEPLIIGVADRLNQMFQNGAYAWNKGALKLLRQLPRPICIDFNDTLANSGRPWFPNPEAIEPVQDLIRVGSLLVVTTAGQGGDDWELRRTALEEFGMWHQEMVLIDASNLGHMHPTQYPKGPGRMYGKRREAIKEWIRINNWEAADKYEESRLTVNPKSLAPAFQKPYEIPLIDDDKYNTDNIPGMLGLLTQPFNRTYWTSGVTEQGLTLAQATERVIEHYAALI